MKPILFNTEAVRGILEDRKTQTRRLVKLKYSNTHLEMFTNKYGTRLIEKQNEEPGVTTVKNSDGTTTHTLLAYIEKTPPYRPGDILYVREAWRIWKAHRYEADAHIEFKADGEGTVLYFPHGKTDSIDRRDYDSFTGKWGIGEKWHPSIHMPREAARIFLRVKDVRVERLRAITVGDVSAEGTPEPTAADWLSVESGTVPPFCWFARMWDSTLKSSDRALYGWAANPWVWVIEFERINKEVCS